MSLPCAPLALLEALRRGPLTRRGNGWAYRGGLFSNATVRRAIDAGLAAIEGDTLIAIAEGAE